MGGIFPSSTRLEVAICANFSQGETTAQLIEAGASASACRRQRSRRLTSLVVFVTVAMRRLEAGQDAWMILSPFF